MHKTQVGTDELERQGNGLLIRAFREMPDWKFSKHRPAVVLYEGQRYQVTKAFRGVDGRYLYHLEVLEDGVHQYPAFTVEYGPELVEARDASQVNRERRQREALLWWVAYPFLGFLPCSTKLWLADRHGFDPLKLTGNSLILEYGVFLMLGTVSILSFFPPGLVLTCMILLADAVVRQAAYSLGSPEQFGFYEWLIRFRLYPRKISRPVDRLGRIREDRK